jgi:hypothetical protein
MKTATTRLTTIESELASKIAITNLLERHPTQQFYTEWTNQQKYLKILKQISLTNDDTDDISRYDTQLDDFKRNITGKVQQMRYNAENAIDQAIDKIITQVVMGIRNEIIDRQLSPQRPYSQLSDQANSIFNSCNQFLAKNRKKPNLSFEIFLKDFVTNFKISKNLKGTLKSHQTDIEFFKTKVNRTITDGHQEKWLQGFTGPLNDIKQEAKWFSFIADSYIKMIDSDRKIAFTKKKTNKLKNWSNFKTFLTEIGITIK